ncbi:MAG TPA: ATP-binding protein [Rhodopila sp.]|uniref:ATP-binding protein n=1 Tax=Rhodopila sp. TaxID=2480087 RepID=UPI002CC1D3B5|nr:ATP-binding protein [Rhodopila sp.]HVY14835.1 ATP-binding protein [Rhodopila sp.]
MVKETRRIGQPLPLLRLLIAATCLFPVVMLGVGGTFLWEDNKDAANRELARRTEVAVQNAARVFETDDVVLDEMERLIRGLSDAQIAARQQELHGELADMAEGLPHVRDLAITGADGHVLVSAGTYPAGTYSIRADQTAGPAEAAGPSGFTISGRETSKPDAKTYFDILRARHGFPGALVVSIRSSFLEDQWTALNVANATAGTAMALSRPDGVILARAPVPRDRGLSLNQVRFAEAMRNASSGTVTAVSQLDGMQRDFRFQRIGNLPLFALGSITHHAILLGFTHRILPHLWFGVPAAILLVSLALLVLRRTTEAEQATRLAAQEQATRVEVERILAKAAKLEALGQLAAGVAHDFNNVLLAVIGNADLVRQRILAGRTTEAEMLTSMVIQAAQRGAELTNGILLFARGSDRPDEAIQPAEVIDGTLAFLPPLLGKAVTVLRQVDAPLWSVRVPKPQLEAALVNLAVNARDAMPDGGTITIRGENIPARDRRLPAELRQDADWVRIAVMDTGPGFPAAVRARVFEPFMTTKDVGRGTGLGLAQVYGTARQAGGLARIEDRAEGGAVVALYLPRGGSATARPDTPFEQAEPTLRALRILLVDHDRLVQITSTIGLREAGHRVIEAERPHDGLEILRGDPAIDVLVVDYAMPGMTGTAMIVEARKARPDLPVVIVSSQMALEGLELPERVVWLAKPFLPDDLMRAVATVAATA